MVQSFQFETIQKEEFIINEDGEVIEENEVFI